MTGAVTLALVTLTSVAGTTVAGATGTQWKARTLAVGVSGPWAAGSASVSCPTGTNSCISVGGGFAQVVSPTGVRSVAVPVPADSPEPGAVLSSVSCTSLTACVAVGWVQSSQGFGGGEIYALAETLSGTTWTASLPDPGVSGAGLTAVSCVAVGSCLAVGNNRFSGSMLTETLSDGTWVTAEVSLGPDAAYPNLADISCVLTTSCVVVGTDVNRTSDVEAVLAGTTWTTTAQDLVSGPVEYGSLFGVSCPPAAALTCVAVGYTNVGAQIMTLSNGTWNAVTGLDFPAGVPFLDAVSCASATACQAVGVSTGSGLLEVQLAGSLWSATILPAPAGVPTTDQLMATTVSCSSAGRCTAMGDGQPSAPNAAGQLRAFTVSDRLADGAWTPSIVAGPALAGAGAISCPAAGSCVMVGSYADQANQAHPVIAAQSGTAWTLSTFSSITVALASVSCPAAGTCVAVGGGQLAVLAGGSWTFSDAPVPTGYAGVNLTAVSCPAPGWCVAVGSTFYAGQFTRSPVVETLSGGTWTVTAPAGTDALDSVSCPEVGSCVAVGVGATAPESYTLTAGTWTPSVDVGPAEASMSGVACHSATSCVAVGYFAPSSTGFEPETYTRRGTTWTADTLPNAGSYGSLSAVSCNSATACVAVGHYATVAYGPTHGLVETLAGGSWSATTGLDPVGSSQTQLTGVFCHPGVACTAVGTTWPTESDGVPSSLPVVEVRTG